MNYMFPFHMVKPGSKIILYGEAIVGKEFYLQIHQSQYATVMAWVDRIFDHYDIEPPFDLVRNIPKYEYDYIVLAVESEKTARSIQKMLMEEYSVEEKKIVWTRFYALNWTIMPENRVEYLKDFDFYLKLLDQYMETDQWFGGSQYYQDYTELGIIGARKNAERITRYHIAELLSKNDTVLDIGCNCGFFDLQLSSYVKDVYGIDAEEKFINIANLTKKKVNIQNVHFECKCFPTDIKSKFNAVMLLGVHNYILDAGQTWESLVEHVVGRIEDNGLLFFESHGMNSDAHQYRSICELFVKQGMQIILHQNNYEDGNRDIVIMRKHG